jgi:hypothetical protein
MCVVVFDLISSSLWFVISSSFHILVLLLFTFGTLYSFNFFCFFIFCSTEKKSIYIFCLL